MQNLDFNTPLGPSPRGNRFFILHLLCVLLDYSPCGKTLAALIFRILTLLDTIYYISRSEPISRNS